ncbi:DUF6059 family protein [Streptomyces maremycinicus]|uniref:DUF6059 family protein n=1 Tax=Streptomyces maremycinicus TaxID=1679753 RepID=UPI000786CE68|nr:DUF6059 family protein [Streptomyces sp. NBRC 110468]
MEPSARDTPHGLPHHPTAAARARAAVVRRCVLPVWRSLKAYGLMCLGLVGYDEVPGPGRTPEDASRARGGAQRPAAGHGPLPACAGPPQGHPERLRPDMPLTATERALARQLSSPLTDNDPTPS